MRYQNRSSDAVGKNPLLAFLFLLALFAFPVTAQAQTTGKPLGQTTSTDNGLVAVQCEDCVALSAQLDEARNNVNANQAELTRLEGLPNASKNGKAIGDVQKMVDDATALVADLEGQLIECASNCSAGAAPSLIPQMSLGKSQDEICRQGRTCAFSVQVTNIGSAPYTGPIFLSESLAVDAGANGALFGGWHCSPAGRGQSVCFTEVNNMPAQASLTMDLNISLPGSLSRSAQNCVTHVIPNTDRLNAQMVQLALAARGYDVGAADGVPGPRTRAALTAFAQADSITLDNTDMPAAYTSLYGAAPNNLGSADNFEGGQACILLDINRPAPAPTPTPTPPVTPTPEPEPEPEPEEAGGVSITLGIPGLQITF